MAQQLQQDLQLAVREADGLRVSLEEQQHSAGEKEQQLQLWAQQLGAECQLLRHLVEPGAVVQGSEPSPTRCSSSYFLIHFSIHLFSIPTSSRTQGWAEKMQQSLFVFILCVSMHVFCVYVSVCLRLCMCCTQFVEIWDCLDCQENFTH